MEVISMSQKEGDRMLLLDRVLRKELKLAKAAELLELSYRHMSRLKKCYQHGAKALVHQLRGKRSNRAKAQSFRDQVLSLVDDKRYADFGPTLAAEELAKQGLHIDHETLRRWWIKSGHWKGQRHRAKHRQWRQRKQCVGEMVQLDGSHHDWFEGRRDKAVLMVYVDDATNRTYARFYQSEETAAVFDSFGRYIRRYGLPRSLYVDRDSIFRCNREASLEEELRGSGPQTQFERAAQKLGVQLIAAFSPQAKGRVERRHGLLQDRLIKQMRLAGISDLAKANEYLEKEFLVELNRRFVVEAACAADLHRRLPPGIVLQEILCFEESRQVARDWTIRWRNRYFQLLRRHEALALVGQKIVVRELLSGDIQLIYKGHQLSWQELPQRPQPPYPPLTKPTQRRRPWKPAADHPWRGGNGRKSFAFPHGGRQTRTTDKTRTFLKSPKIGHF